MVRLLLFVIVAGLLTTACAGSPSASKASSPTATATPSTDSGIGGGAATTTTTTPSFGNEIAASDGSKLYILRESDGSIVQSYPLQHPITTRPVSINGVLYFSTLSTAGASSTSDELVALRASDDQQLWTFDLGINANVGSDQDFPVENGVIYASGATSDGTSHLYALRASDGKELWHFDAATLRPPAAVANGVVYIGVQPQDGSQYLYALNAADGTQLWTYRFSQGMVYGDPVVADGNVYVGDIIIVGEGGPGSFKVYALRDTDGTPIWHTGVLPGNTYGAVASGSAIYFTIASNTDPLQALNGQSGITMWTASATGQLAIQNSVLFAYNGNQSQIVAIQAGSGSIIWRSPTESFTSEVFAADNLVFAGTHEPALDAFHASDGTLAWSVKLSGFLSWRPVPLQ